MYFKILVLLYLIQNYFSLSEVSYYKSLYEHETQGICLSLNLTRFLLLLCLGPFNNQEMAEWFQAGYFTMSLLVKRACDESFQPLGDIMKMWGRVPFSPGPAPPPHMVSIFLMTWDT